MELLLSPVYYDKIMFPHHYDQTKQSGENKINNSIQTHVFHHYPVNSQIWGHSNYSNHQIYSPPLPTTNDIQKQNSPSMTISPLIGIPSPNSYLLNSNPTSPTLDIFPNQNINTPSQILGFYQANPIPPLISATKSLKLRKYSSLINEVPPIPSTPNPPSSPLYSQSDKLSPINSPTLSSQTTKFDTFLLSDEYPPSSSPSSLSNTPPLRSSSNDNPNSNQININNINQSNISFSTNKNVTTTTTTSTISNNKTKSIDNEVSNLLSILVNNHQEFQESNNSNIVNDLISNTEILLKSLKTIKKKISKKKNPPKENMKSNNQIFSIRPRRDRPSNSLSKNENNFSCQSCGKKETPEWRRGPNGSKTLCNACGLYYSKCLKKESELNNQPTKEPKYLQINNIINENNEEENQKSNQKSI